MERQSWMRLVISSGVRRVRVESAGSVRRSCLINWMHFWIGIEGKRAVASQEARISSAWILTFFANLMKSWEFLQVKGESLRSGQMIGMRKLARPP